MATHWNSTKDYGPSPADVARRELMGIELRSFVVLQIRDAGGTLRVREIVAAIHAAGFAVAGRPSKVISDALRWEVARGRVVRVGRGVYRSDRRIPRTTMCRMRARVAAACERELRPVRAQPLREHRPLVNPDGPWRYRLRYGLAPPRRPTRWPTGRPTCWPLPDAPGSTATGRTPGVERPPRHLG